MSLQTQRDKSALVKLAHEHYSDRWMKLYEMDAYRRWLFSGMIAILKRYTKNGSVLEIGCSKGFLSDLLNHEGYRAVGGDISLTALLGAQKTEKVRLDGEILPFKNRAFDAVLAISTIEHLPKPSRAINEIFKVLKRKGIFIAVTPDKESFIAKLGRRLVDYTSLKNPYHVGLLSRNELRVMTQKAGFEYFTILPFHNGYYGAPFLKYLLKKEFLPIPTTAKMPAPFSHHQLVIALKRI